MKRIAFINHKGGCGKTTSLFHIAGELAFRGYKVLVIDTDKQLDTTHAFLAEDESNFDEDTSLTIIDFIKGSALNDVVKKNYIKVGNRKPAYKGIDVIPADRGLDNQNLIMDVLNERGREIKKAFEKLDYDFILIDCPPSNVAVEKLVLGYIATDVITPMSCDSNAIRGYGELLNLVDEMRNVNNTLQMLGIFLSMYSDFRRKHREYKQALSKMCRVFIDVQIPYSSDIVTSLEDKGQPISYYKKSKARGAVKQLVDKIIGN